MNSVTNFLFHAAILAHLLESESKRIEWEQRVAAKLSQVQSICIDALRCSLQALKSIGRGTDTASSDIDPVSKVVGHNGVQLNRGEMESMSALLHKASDKVRNIHAEVTSLRLHDSPQGFRGPPHSEAPPTTPAGLQDQIPSTNGSDDGFSKQARLLSRRSFDVHSSSATKQKQEANSDMGTVGIDDVAVLEDELKRQEAMETMAQKIAAKDMDVVELKEHIAKLEQVIDEARQKVQDSIVFIFASASTHHSDQCLRRR